MSVWTALPEKYRWLDSVAPPKMVVEARRLYGTVETPGPGSNRSILDWAKETGLQAVYSTDSIPWCGLFMAVVVKRTNRTPPVNPLWARNWAKFGLASATASLGDVLVFSRGSGGHVGLYVAEDKTAYHVLGGNQSDAVTITRIQKSRMIACRRPVYINRPESAKPVHMTASGALSRSEA